jgi:Cu(I)/Ag(I) efflux system membrane fusion protein
VVEEVDPGQRRVRIAHGPIEALGWPSMTMVFTARPDVDLAGLAAGENVRFVLEQEHAGEYELAQVFSGASGGATEQVEKAQKQELAEPEPPRRVMSTGTIREVMADERKLRMTHAPIPEIGWPEMTMNFGLTDAVDTSVLAAGQEIHFVMVQQDDRWVVDEIHVMSDGAGQEHDHD